MLSLEEPMGQVTHEQANLLLRLYELRREPRLREARAWFTGNFNAKTPEEMNEKYPPGSEGNVNLRMTVSYWEMAATLVNRGLIDDELFFENSGESLVRVGAPARSCAGHAGRIQEPAGVGSTGSPRQAHGSLAGAARSGSCCCFAAKTKSRPNCYGQEVGISRLSFR
jgi:hypothetical protein